MPEYEVQFHPSFLRCLKKYPHEKERVRKFIKRLQDDPYRAGRSHRLKLRKGIDLRGKRGAHVSQKLVLVFMICEECINSGFRAKGYNQCDLCPEAPVKRLILLAFGAHELAYSHTWGA